MIIVIPLNEWYDGYLSAQFPSADLLTLRARHLFTELHSYVVGSHCHRSPRECDRLSFKQRICFRHIVIFPLIAIAQFVILSSFWCPLSTCPNGVTRCVESSLC